MATQVARSLSLAAAMAASWSSPSPAASEKPIPALVALTLDTSGSLRPRGVARTRELAIGVLSGLPSGSEVAVFTFDDQSRLLLPRTSDPERVRKALSRVAVAGRFTALHDALYDASRYLRDAPPARKAIVLLTDGRDENSALNLDDGLKVAQENAIPVYAVGIGAVEERALRRIAKLTGGAYLRDREATGELLAERILAALPAPASPPPAALPPVTNATPPSTSPTVAASARRVVASGRRGLAAVLLLAVGIAAVAMTVWALRRRPRPACPSCGRTLDKGESCGFCAPGKAKALDELTLRPSAPPETMLVRVLPAEEPVDRTVALRERHVLSVTAGPGSGQVFALNPAIATSLGRSPGNDIVLEDSSVSAQHCRIRPEDGRFVLHDLESTNGTFVNERRVKRHSLLEGDVIRVGETSLQFRREQGRGF